MIDTVVDQATTRGVATLLADIHGLVLVHILDRDRARGPHHRYPANLVSHPGSLEGKANEKPWTLNSSGTVTST